MKYISTHTATKSGFIALMSAVIISMILAGLSWTTSIGLFRTRIGMLDREFQNQSRRLAQSCIYSALLKIRQNYFYIPQIDGDSEYSDTDHTLTCTIIDVIHETENSTTHEKIVTITTRAEYHGVWSMFETKATIHNDFFPSDQSIPQIIILSEHEI